MTAITDACATITRWYPAAAALVTQPDTDGTHIHGQPGSKPPWNPAAASAYLDAHEGIRRLEASLRIAVTGRPGPRRGGTDANTLAAIDAIENLSHAITQQAADLAARILQRWAVPIEQLPAIDHAERWQRVPDACCPYCQTPMLRLQPRSGRVTCGHYGACYDANGNHPHGRVQTSYTGDPVVAWDDGLVQYAAVNAA